MDGNGLWEEEGRDARNLCSPPSMATVDVQSAGFSEVCAVWCQDVAKMTKAQTVGREFEAAAAGAVRGLFLSIGVIGVMTVTVRVKPGLRKSWALVSFERPEQAAAAVAADHEVQPVAGGEFTKLRVEPGTVRQHLRTNGWGGALGGVAKRHEGKRQESTPANPQTKLSFKHAVRLSCWPKSPSHPNPPGRCQSLPLAAEG